MFRFFSCVLALCLLTSPARAAEIGKYSVGGWTVTVNTDDTMGVFSTCIAGASYRSGIDMHVAVTANFSWNLGFSSPNWRLKPGDRISIQYRFDRSRWTGASAEVLSETLVFVPMPPDGEIAALFRRSRTMEITDGRDTFFFDLDGTSRLLASLVQCVQTQLAQQPGTVSADAPAVAAQPDETTLRLEGTRVLSNFLLAANFAGAQMVDPEHAPKSIAIPHAVAVQGDLITVAIVVPQPERRAERIAADIAALISEDCDGNYGGGSTKETIDDTSLVSAFTACQGKTSSYYLQFVVVPRNPAGHYVIGLLSPEPLQSNAGADEGKAASVTIEQFRQAAFRASQ